MGVAAAILHHTRLERDDEASATANPRQKFVEICARSATALETGFATNLFFCLSQSRKGRAKKKSAGLHSSLCVSAPLRELTF